MRSDIVPGATFPDYALPDHTGTVRTLSDLQGRDPMILTLARGNYCPKEHRQHLELAEHYPEIAVAYTQVATIATDDHHTLQEFRASVGAQWPFLSDPGRTVQQDLDIAEYTDPEHNPMIPHTLVLKPGLVIHSVYTGYWFWGRPSFYDLWRDLRAATAEIVASGVDVVVAQGWEAGGHVWGTIATLPLVPAVVDAVDPVPVIAAGGIGDARGVAAVLALGAQAAWLGTRFLLAEEMPIHQDYRRRLITAAETDPQRYSDLWRDLRAAMAEIRPDWDLSAPGLREAWDAGDYSKFHGWDLRSPQSMPTSYQA